MKKRLRINPVTSLPDLIGNSGDTAYTNPSRPAVNTVAEALDDLYTIAAAAEKYLPIPETEIITMFNQNR